MVKSINGRLVNFGELFDQYYPTVVKYFLFHGMDADSANDLATAVFERALLKIGTFDPSKAAFNTWIFAIAHNLGINNWKDEAKTYVVLNEGARNQPGLDPTIEDTLVHREGIAALLIALGELDERERDIVALKFSGALTNRQIARLVNLNSSNIGVILFRALHKMKSKLLIIEGQVCDE